MSIPVKRVLRHITPAHLSIFGVFWLVMVLVWAIVLLFVRAYGTVDFSVWLVVGQGTPKWFVMVIGMLAAAVALPSYVASGITRRDVALASGLLYGANAVVFGLIALAVYGLEAAVYEAIGVMDRMESYVVATAADAGWVVLEAALLALVWTIGGWLIGAGFYRFGVWLGIIFIAPASIPFIVAELMVNSDVVGWSGVEPVTGWPVVWMIVPSVVGLIGAYLIVRDVPIRKVSG